VCTERAEGDGGFVFWYLVVVLLVIVKGGVMCTMVVC